MTDLKESAKKLIFKMEDKNQAQKEAVFYALKQAGYHWFGRAIDTIDDTIKDWSVLCIYPSDKEITHWQLDNAIVEKYPIFDKLETLYMVCDYTINPKKYMKRPKTGMERLERLIKNTNYGNVNVGKVELPFGERVLQHIQATPPTWTDFSGKVSGSLEYGDNVAEQDWYTSQGIEPIDYMKANFTKDEYRGFLHGNVQKYLTRHKAKNGIKDLEKAKVYLEWLITDWEER